jgi:Fe(3+) dicitrate transport protein
VADLAAFFVLPGEVRLFTTLENMTNATYMVSRRPFGARPGKPITFMAGISYAL